MQNNMDNDQYRKGEQYFHLPYSWFVDKRNDIHARNDQRQEPHEQTRVALHFGDFWRQFVCHDDLIVYQIAAMTIVRADSVRKDSVYFPEGAIVMEEDNPYTERINNYPVGQWNLNQWRKPVRGENSILEPIKENEMNKTLLDTIFNAVALGMGVAVIVLNTLGTLTINTAITLLSIGLTALAMAGLQKE